MCLYDLIQLFPVMLVMLAFVGVHGKDSQSPQVPQLGSLIMWLMCQEVNIHIYESNGVKPGTCLHPER